METPSPGRESSGNTLTQAKQESVISTDWSRLGTNAPRSKIEETVIGEYKELSLGERVIKEELGKLTDSACESLNESEESGSKYQENISSCEGLERGESDKDSLECEEDEDLGESEEDGSADNNTFNVINTENSESQEISELTNEEDGKHEENDEKSTCSQGITKESNNGLLELSEAATNSVTDNDSLSEEVSEDSVENTGRDDDEFNDSLDEEEEETSNSKQSENNSKCDSNTAEMSKVKSVPPSKVASQNQNAAASRNAGAAKNNNEPNNSVDLANAQSPKSRKRLGIPFGNNKNIKNKNEFKIEIFESKRKPEVSTINETSENNKELVSNVGKPRSQRINTEKDEIEGVIDKVENESLDSPQSSDKHSSEQLTLTMDSTSPESLDKTSLLLDVSQVIKEESEESDALSPMKSLVEDIQNSPQELPNSTENTRRQQESKTATASSSISGTKPASSVSSNSAVTPTSPATDSNTSKAACNSLAAAQNVLQSSSNSSSSVTTGTPSDVNKKPCPMAFTVELGDSAASDSSGSGSTGKKLNISASISQWAPKHRRNLSLSKVEENKKVEETQSWDKPPLGRPRSGTVGAGSLGTRRGGYHSEGYFSSDQDDEGPRRTDLKSPRSPRAPPPDSVRSPPSNLIRTPSHESPKEISVRMRPPSPLSSPSNPYAVPLNESASYLIEKMMNATPETKRKHNNNRQEGRTCCKERERKPSVSELTGKTFTKADKNSPKMGSDSRKQVRHTPTEDIDPGRDDNDDGSETGTYTIDKDSPSPDTDQARNDIERIFGVTTESEAEMTSSTAVPLSTTDQCQEDESSWISASEMPPAISRNSPNWIQHWAAQVAEQTKPPLESLSSHCKLSLQSPRGHKVMTSQESNESRPRRKLPTLPSQMSQQNSGCGSPRAVDTCDGEIAKNRYWRGSLLSNDLTSDTEAFLRDTENIVTSLQARVDKTKVNPAFRNASFESHESGGDSDIDTSTSYPFNDDERLSASLRNKLRLSGLHPLSKNLPSPSAGVASPRRLDGGTIRDTRPMNKEAQYEVYSSQRENRAEQSDSSSETSEQYKEPPTRPSDNNPPLKFNRAFSLRRARLGCDDPVTNHTPVEKKKISRPSSAGAASSNRTRTPLGATKSYQSMDSSRVSSPRSSGFGSPRGVASSSHTVVGGSKGTPSSDNFDRTDGGRFSLRLPRPVGPSSIGVVKSPSKANIKRDPSTSNSKKNSLRSNSTLTSKEVDFQNWKRRKNYDPMKAAAEGRKKQKEKTIQQPQPSVHTENRSPSPVGGLLRSASFHGTEGGMGNVRWSLKNSNAVILPQYTSEDDGPYSLEEEIGPHPSPMHGSPLRRSPTSPHHMCSSPLRQPANLVPRGRRPSLGHSEEAEMTHQYQANARKVSLEESGSEGKRSPMSPMNAGQRGASAGSSASVERRPKTKMEALDNLVISTIHSLSVKVRTTSESLLQKLKSHYDEEGDRAALLEEVLSHLSESDQSLTSGQTRSTSRELAGILRNLKKIEHALEVIDRVIILGDDDYPEDEDLLDEVPQDWVESDY